MDAATPSEPRALDAQATVFTTTMGRMLASTLNESRLPQSPGSSQSGWTPGGTARAGYSGLFGDGDQTCAPTSAPPVYQFGNPDVGASDLPTLPQSVTDALDPQSPAVAPRHAATVPPASVPLSEVGTLGPIAGSPHSIPGAGPSRPHLNEPSQPPAVQPGKASVGFGGASDWGDRSSTSSTPVEAHAFPPPSDSGVNVCLPVDDDTISELAASDLLAIAPSCGSKVEYPSPSASRLGEPSAPSPALAASPAQVAPSPSVTHHSQNPPADQHMRTDGHLVLFVPPALELSRITTTAITLVSTTWGNATLPGGELSSRQAHVGRALLQLVSDQITLPAPLSERLRDYLLSATPRFCAPPSDVTVDHAVWAMAISTADATGIQSKSSAYRVEYRTLAEITQLAYGAVISPAIYASGYSGPLDVSPPGPAQATPQSAAASVVGSTTPSASAVVGTPVPSMEPSRVSEGDRVAIVDGYHRKSYGMVEGPPTPHRISVRLASTPNQVVSVNKTSVTVLTDADLATGRYPMLPRPAEPHSLESVVAAIRLLHLERRLAESSLPPIPAEYELVRLFSDISTDYSSEVLVTQFRQALTSLHSTAQQLILTSPPTSDQTHRLALLQLQRLRENIEASFEAHTAVLQKVIRMDAQAAAEQQVLREELMQVDASMQQPAAETEQLRAQLAKVRGELEIAGRTLGSVFMEPSSSVYVAQLPEELAFIRGLLEERQRNRDTDDQEMHESMLAQLQFEQEKYRRLESDDQAMRENMLAQLQSEQVNHATAMNEMKDLRATNANLLEQLSTQQRKYDESDAHCAQLIARIGELTDEPRPEVSRAAHSEVLNELNEMRAGNASLSSRLDGALEELERVTLKGSEQNEQSSFRVAELSRELQAARDELAHNLHLSHELKATRDELEQARQLALQPPPESDRDALEDAIIGLERKLADVTAERDVARSDARREVVAASSLRHEMQQLRLGHQAQVRRAEAKQATIAADVAARQRRLDDLQQHFDQLQQADSEKGTSLEVLEAEHVRLAEDFAAVTAECERLRSTGHARDVEHLQQTNLRPQLAQLEQELAAARAQIEQLNSAADTHAATAVAWEDLGRRFHHLGAERDRAADDAVQHATATQNAVAETHRLRAALIEMASEFERLRAIAIDRGHRIDELRASLPPSTPLPPSAVPGAAQPTTHQPPQPTRLPADPQPVPPMPPPQPQHLPPPTKPLSTAPQPQHVPLPPVPQPQPPPPAGSMPPPTYATAATSTGFGTSHHAEPDYTVLEDLATSTTAALHTGNTLIGWLPAEQTLAIQRSAATDFADDCAFLTTAAADATQGMAPFQLSVSRPDRRGDSRLGSNRLTALTQAANSGSTLFPPELGVGDYLARQSLWLSEGGPGARVHMATTLSDLTYNRCAARNIASMLMAHGRVGPAPLVKSLVDLFTSLQAATFLYEEAMPANFLCELALFRLDTLMVGPHSSAVRAETTAWENYKKAATIDVTLRMLVNTAVRYYDPTGQKGLTPITVWDDMERCKAIHAKAVTLYKGQEWNVLNRAMHSRNERVRQQWMMRPAGPAGEKDPITGSLPTAAEFLGYNRLYIIELLAVESSVRAFPDARGRNRGGRGGDDEPPPIVGGVLPPGGSPGGGAPPGGAGGSSSSFPPTSRFRGPGGGPSGKGNHTGKGTKGKPSPGTAHPPPTHGYVPTGGGGGSPADKIIVRQVVQSGNDFISYASAQTAIAAARYPITLPALDIFAGTTLEIPAGFTADDAFACMELRYDRLMHHFDSLSDADKSSVAELNPEKPHGGPGEPQEVTFSRAPRPRAHVTSDGVATWGPGSCNYCCNAELWNPHASDLPDHLKGAAEAPPYMATLFRARGLPQAGCHNPSGCKRRLLAAFLTLSKENLLLFVTYDDNKIKRRREKLNKKPP